MRASEGGAQKRSQSMSRSSDASSSVGTEYADRSIFVSIRMGPPTVVPMDAHQRSLVTGDLDMFLKSFLQVLTKQALRKIDKAAVFVEQGSGCSPETDLRSHISIEISCDLAQSRLISHRVLTDSGIFCML